MSTFLTNKNIGWEDAIQDAKKQLQDVENRALVLRGVIKTFSDKLERGGTLARARKSGNGSRVHSR